MTYPILEYDATREAFIEPAKVIRPLNMPEHCVITFFQDTIDKIVAEHDAVMLAENSWEDGPHPLYEIAYKGRRLAFFHPGVGAARAAAIFEEVIAFGGRKFIACGGCGVLDGAVGLGDLVVVDTAVRDEGLSYHYLPPGREVKTHEKAIAALEKTLRGQNISYRPGKTWTTDAPYRETPGKIARRKAEGCLVVEMEAAGLMAVAQFRDVIFGQVLYGGDDLSGAEWDRRGWTSQTDVRENLFWLCADACLTL
ncbi:MAG TPA: phosphorylase [Anaerolineae bacterium]|nr:phosphorylase [Anaerolineae bacterium]